MKEVATQLASETDDYEGGATAVTISAQAARVIEKASNVEALTLEQFKYPLQTHERCFLSPRRALILDESSMFSSDDLKTALEIAAQVGYERIILAGDKDQLPPVGWGAPFFDLIKKGVCPVTYLKTIHRTDAGGGIAQICRDIREGNSLRRDYSQVQVYDAANGEIADKVTECYMEMMTKGIAPDKIKVLSLYSSPTQDFGAPALSLAIRKARGLPDQMTVGDLLIGTKNERFPRYILNGSRGVVIRAGRKKGGVNYKALSTR
jgi:hypothetical protein